MQNKDHVGLNPSPHMHGHAFLCINTIYITICLYKIFNSLKFFDFKYLIAINFTVYRYIIGLY